MSVPGDGQDAVCTVALVADHAPPRGWLGRNVLAGNMGSIPRKPWQSKSVCDLLAQSRELLKQMQAN